MAAGGGAFEIAGRRIGGDAPCFVIAEAGVNHNGDVDLAHKLIDAAAEAGVDAVKFQTFDPDALAAADAPKAAYQVARTGAVESQREMLRRLVLPEDAYPSLMQHAVDRKLVFLSTPFDPKSAALLDRLQLPAMKISSGEVTNHPFLSLLAGLRRPLLLSTGMSDLDEVRAAVEVVRARSQAGLALFHCTSSYPAPIESINLRAMDTLREAFGAPTGYSDHSVGAEVPSAAVARGAQLLEKHITLDRAMAGPDHSASMEPGPFAAMMRGLRVIEQALGDGKKCVQPSERDVQVVARRSLYAARDLPAGHALAPDDVACRRPARGLSPARLLSLIGRRLRRAVAAEAMLGEDDFE
jgi:N,N'-diacetyllegionaminate synthase